jgi:hypothetical protein
LNLRTLYAFLQAKKARGNTVSILQTITGWEDRAVLESPPIEPIKKHKQNCRPSIEQKELTNTSKKIILRLDDVWAGTPVWIFKKFVVDTNRYHAPLVLWIIPEWLETNTELTTFLESESCNLEFAIHGLDHFSAQSTTGNIRFISEFSEISFGDALTRLQKAKEILSSHTDEPIITFIPPYNLISEEWVLAVKQIWLKVISSIWTWAFDAQLGENRHEARSVFSKAKVLEGCKYSLDNEGICTYYFVKLYWKKSGQVIWSFLKVVNSSPFFEKSSRSQRYS